MVSGTRVFPVAAPAGQGSVSVELQRREARTAPASHAEGLHGADAAVLRLFSERLGQTGLDDEWDSIHRPGTGKREDQYDLCDARGCRQERHQAVDASPSTPE